MGDTPVTRHPFVKWGQNETHVFLSVQLGDAEQSRYTVTGRAILIRLRKELKDAWPRLTIQSEKLPWAHLDFDLYQFDASDEEPPGDETEGNVKVKVIRPTKEERAS
ncbi:hypothetical protein X801_03134 [Opisthorchis viverrini]|uniref:CS domain-containing protein n=1 Tax=Opisthorchis viverrini TaxID=6198 RepID=A0A1S8X2P0_OPIVI|nr:hypothetical protein X801_03134 [Opisthorchis viverrini]